MIYWQNTNFQCRKWSTVAATVFSKGTLHGCRYQEDVHFAKQAHGSPQNLQVEALRVNLHHFRHWKFVFGQKIIERPGLYERLNRFFHQMDDSKAIAGTREARVAKPLPVLHPSCPAFLTYPATAEIMDKHERTRRRRCRHVPRR